MRPTLRILAVTAIAALTACSHEPTGVLTEQDALDAAARFQSLANDAYNAGADPDVVGAYRDVASAVLRNGRISPVTIVLDGVATEFLATARQMEIDGGPACSQPGSLCLMAAPLRSVIAWQRSDPRRVVQLTATAGTTAIGPAVPVLVDASVTIASLIYFDGAGGVYAGTSGTQRIDDPVQSDTPCYTGPPVPTASAMAMLAQCTRAEFTASFNGVLAPSPIPARHNTATGTHTITMASQSIHGARLVLPAAAYPCIVCYGLPRELMPPIVLWGTALPISVSAAATASAVTFTLRLGSSATGPATVLFSSGQQFDVRVRKLDGSIVWVWSADKAFTAALTSRTLAAGETVTYTASWTPTTKGDLIAEGWLTSTSHRARSVTAFTVP